MFSGKGLIFMSGLIFPLNEENLLGVTRLEIISGEPSDTMTGQIHFNSVTYRFWPVKFMRQITLKTRAKKQLWVQIFRGVEGPRNLLEILSNACRYNIFETYLGYWGC